VRLTKSQRLQAKENGILNATVHSRIRLGWDVKEAITIPPNSHYVLDADVIAQAAANGINKHTLYTRIYVYEWDEERAITESPDKAGRWFKREGIKG
jgi:hypothetical protein